jgi:GWxTD domain-containing protein
MKYFSTIYFLILAGFVSCSRSTMPAVAPLPVKSRILHDIALQYTSYTEKDSMQLFLLFEDKNGVLDVSKSATQLTYTVKAGKHERDELFLKDTIFVGADPLVDTEGGLYLQIKLPREVVQTPHVVHLQLWQKLEQEVRMGSLFQLPLAGNMLQKQQVLVDAYTDRPIIRNYITTSEKLKLKSAANSTTLTVPYIDVEFMPALPPMSTRQVQQPRTLPIADTLSLSSADTIQFENAGLYLLWINQPYAQSLLVQPWSYPKVTMARELVEPLIYVTTSQEREQLKKASDPKKAIDSFWLQIARGNVEVARSLIREFYKRVETANKLFSSHEAGWASDRGMIHILFGIPNEITRAGQNETWIYNQTKTRPYIKFVFTKKQNTFTENHYELVRLRDYQDVWYSTVAKWRAGITEI